MPKSLRGLALSLSNGFTLIELLVVISIIAILSAVGLVSYNGIRTKALEAQRISNIDAIKKALETKFDPTANGGQGGYKAILDTDFANGKIPVPNPSAPFSSSNTYLKTTANSDGTYANFYACVNKADGSICYAKSAACYCKSSNQGIPVTVPQNGAAACDPSGNLLNGLVGYWKFDEGSGTTTIDSSGNGLPASLSGGVTWSSTVKQVSFGKSISFGANGQVVAPQNSTLNSVGAGPFTLSLWVNPATFSGWPQFINKGTQLVINGGLGVLRSGGLQGAAYFPAPVPTNTWTNLILTYDPTLVSTAALKTYTQGVFRPPSPPLPSVSGGRMGVNANSLVIGGEGNTGNWYNGLIDEVRVYNVVLNQTQISLIASGCLAP